MLFWPSPEGLCAVALGNNNTAVTNQVFTVGTRPRDLGDVIPFLVEGHQHQTHEGRGAWDSGIAWCAANVGPGPG